MSIETIQGLEYTISDEGPSLDGDYIRNVLVLGMSSKNAWNASVTGVGDPNGPRRKFNKVIAASEEIAKLDGKPAYVLHKAPPRVEDDLLGKFEGPRASDNGLRMDLLCRKVNGSEAYHPHIVALRDDIAKKRPFGGFSPRFDFTIDPVTGEVQTILACESIDLVAQPASVKSAVEGESYVTREEHAALEERVRACECYMAANKTAGSEKVAEKVAAKESLRSDPPPVPKKIVTTAKNFREYVRS